MCCACCCYAANELEPDHFRRAWQYAHPLMACTSSVQCFQWVSFEKKKHFCKTFWFQFSLGFRSNCILNWFSSILLYRISKVLFNPYYSKLFILMKTSLMSVKVFGMLICGRKCQLQKCSLNRIKCRLKLFQSNSAKKLFFDDFFCSKCNFVIFVQQFNFIYISSNEEKYE